jgi:hypothetical protein
MFHRQPPAHFPPCFRPRAARTSITPTVGAQVFAIRAALERYDAFLRGVVLDEPLLRRVFWVEELDDGGGGVVGVFVREDEAAAETVQVDGLFGGHLG